MFDNKNFYHSCIRNAIVAFGRLFSNVKVVRTTTDRSQTIVVPLAYASKEKYLRRIEEQPDLTGKKVLITLPRMSFEMTGMGYSADRKLPRTNVMKKFKETSDLGTNIIATQFTPVPYDLKISLYVMTKTQEDALQIVEQIVPYFTPDYTVSISMVPEMEIIQKIPIILNGVSFHDDYDGNFETRRAIVYTLDFTARMEVYGPVSVSSDIRTVIANISDQTENLDADVFNSTYVALVDPADADPNGNYDIDSTQIENE